tara:strand:+ start:516 stop:704 length:189 start_codon:yes stop_codon:yes gene_type:complete
MLPLLAVLISNDDASMGVSDPSNINTWWQLPESWSQGRVTPKTGMFRLALDPQQKGVPLLHA